jgi:hypothetical protein
MSAIMTHTFANNADKKQLTLIPMENTILAHANF